MGEFFLCLLFESFPLNLIQLEENGKDGEILRIGDKEQVSINNHLIISTLYFQFHLS